MNRFEYITFIQKPGRDEAIIWVMLGVRAWHITHAVPHTLSSRVYSLLFAAYDHPLTWMVATVALWLIHGLIICMGTARMRANVLLFIFFWYGVFAWMAYGAAPSAAYWMDNVVMMAACAVFFCCSLAQNPNSLRPWAVKLADRIIHQRPNPPRQEGGEVDAH